MKTFDFKQARKQVTKIEGDFKKVHALLDGFALSILDRGVIDTILHKAQADTTKAILTGQLINTEVYAIDIESSLSKGAAIAADYAKDVMPGFIQQNTGDWITTDDTSSR